MSTNAKACNLITEIENSIYLPGDITGYQRNPCNGFAFHTGKGGGGGGSTSIYFLPHNCGQRPVNGKGGLAEGWLLTFWGFYD